MIYKRGKKGTYWIRFRFDGRMVHESTNTTSREIAKDVERKRRREEELSVNGLQERRGMAPSFEKAAARWMEGRRKSKSAAKTVSIGTVALKHLLPVFGKRLLRDFSVEALLDYQDMRIREGAAPRTVNMEIGTLRQIVLDSDYGECWRQLRDRKGPEGRGKFEMLKENKDAGRALSADEERRVLEAAHGLDSAAYTAIVLSLNTSMRHDEIRTLRWANADFEHKSLSVAKSKTEAGKGRIIPLNSAALQVLAQWGMKFPNRKPEHYVFPRIVRWSIDPTRHADGWRTAWEHARRLAGVHCRFHDLRVTCITKLAEGQASEQTIMAIAGHVSKEMLRHYSKIRDGAKRNALDALVHQNVHQIGVEEIATASMLLN